MGTDAVWGLEGGRTVLMLCGGECATEKVGGEGMEWE